MKKILLILIFLISGCASLNNSSIPNLSDDYVYQKISPCKQSGYTDYTQYNYKEIIDKWEYRAMPLDIQNCYEKIQDDKNNF